MSLAQSARVMDAVLADIRSFKERETPPVSDEYITLLRVMWMAEDVAMQPADIGIAMLVRDKLDALIERASEGYA
jgi:hypothetical protein